MPFVFSVTKYKYRIGPDLRYIVVGPSRTVSAPVSFATISNHVATVNTATERILSAQYSLLRALRGATDILRRGYDFGMKRSADVNHDEIIDTAAGYIARGWRRSVVRRALRKQFDVSEVDDIIDAAHRRLEEDLVAGKNVLAFAQAFFRELAADETVTDSARIRAMERFCALHGILGGEQGGDVDEQQERLREFLREAVTSVPAVPS